MSDLATSAPRWSWKRPFGRWTWLMAILFLPVVPAYIFIGWGWLLADRVFQPRHVAAKTNGAVRVVQTARVAVGFVMVAVLYIVYTAEGIDRFLNDVFVKALWAMGIGAVALAIGIGLFARFSDDQGRRQIISRALRYPTITLLQVIGTAGGLLLVAWLSTMALPEPVGFVVLAVGVFQIAFSLRAMFLVTKNVFNAVEVHPLLPCVLTPPIAWALVAAEAFQAPALPPQIHLVTSLSGAGLVTVIAVVEWFVLRRDNPGLSVDNGLWTD